MIRTGLLGIAGALIATACASGGGTTAPRTRPIAGIYDGTTANGGAVTWTLAQTDTTVIGTGTFVLTGPDSMTATYTIRGVMRSDQLAVRLVGAPGDADADSVTYVAQYAAELYTATAFAGLVSNGNGSPLAGELQIVRRSGM